MHRSCLFSRRTEKTLRIVLAGFNKERRRLCASFLPVSGRRWETLRIVIAGLREKRRDYAQRCRSLSYTLLYTPVVYTLPHIPPYVHTLGTPCCTSVPCCPTLGTLVYAGVTVRGSWALVSLPALGESTLRRVSSFLREKEKRLCAEVSLP